LQGRCLFLIEKKYFLFYKTRHLNKEVNGSVPAPSVIAPPVVHFPKDFKNFGQMPFGQMLYGQSSQHRLQ